MRSSNDGEHRCNSHERVWAARSDMVVPRACRFVVLRIARFSDPSEREVDEEFSPKVPKRRLGLLLCWLLRNLSNIDRWQKYEGGFSIVPFACNNNPARSDTWRFADP